MKENKVNISIIIPVYNAAAYLERCLNSILKQSFVNYEIIIINDGSTDNSLEIINRYCSLNRHFKCYSIDNAGQGNARNHGIDKSSGEYICFVDADDEITYDYLEVLYRQIIEDKSDMSICFLERIFEYKPRYIEKNFSYQDRFVLSKAKTVRENPEFILRVINAPYCKLIKRKFLLDNKIEFPLGIIYEDAVFTHLLLSYNPLISVVDNTNYKYYVHHGSTMTSNKKNEDMFLAADKIINNYKKIMSVNEELSYYVFHHVCIGIVYREFRRDCFSLFSSLKKTKTFLLNHNLTIRNNKYLKNKAIYIKFFALFYS